MRCSSTRLRPCRADRPPTHQPSGGAVMAAITPSTVPTAGLLAAPAAVSASDTNPGHLIPLAGLVYRGLNGGGSPHNVSLSHRGTTPARQPGTATPGAGRKATTH